MREIKFRAWDKKKMVMRNSVDIKSSAIGARACYATPNSFLIFYSEIGDEALMQFTGLHDKNGKEIYEGDIISHPHDGVYLAKHEVVFHKGAFRPKPLWGRGVATPTQNASYYFWNGIEVIGNIYENPDLLSK